MRKILNFIVIILASTIIAGIYGILHDQVTYSISREYYTLFKFEQFGINDWGVSDERIKAGIIGFLATWWVGLILGIFYAISSLFLNSNKSLKVSLQAILLNIGIAIIFGIVGYFYGALFLNAESSNLFIPEGATNVQAYINVGSIHNFGYSGGFLGMVIGIFYQVRRTKKLSVSKQ